MLRVDRDKIEMVKVALQDCLKSGKTAGENLPVLMPDVDDDVLERATLLALASLGMDVFHTHEVITPSDVAHIGSINARFT